MNSHISDRFGQNRTVIGYDRHRQDPHSNIIRSMRRVFNHEMGQLRADDGHLITAGQPYNLSAPVRPETALQAVAHLEAVLTSPRGESRKPLVEPEDFIVNATPNGDGVNVDLVLFERNAADSNPVNAEALAAYNRSIAGQTAGGWNAAQYAVPAGERALLDALNKGLQPLEVRGKADFKRRMGNDELKAYLAAQPAKDIPDYKPNEMVTAGVTPNAIDDAWLPVDKFSGRLSDGITVPARDAEKVKAAMQAALTDSGALAQGQFTIKEKKTPYESRIREVKLTVEVPDLSLVNVDAARAYAARPGKTPVARRANFAEHAERDATAPQRA